MCVQRSCLIFRRWAPSTEANDRAMIATLHTIMSFAALIQPEGCGNATNLWGHAFPSMKQNIPVQCTLIDATDSARVETSSNRVHLFCHNDTHCAYLFKSQILKIQGPASPRDVLVAAANFGSRSYLCSTTAACNHSNLECTSGYCSPALGSRTYPWPTVCFDGAHATCSELITSGIGVAAGFVLTLLYHALRGA